MFSFTGQGWIGPVLTVMCGMVGACLGAIYVWGTFAGAMFFAAISVLLASLVASAIGRELNTERTAQGHPRTYHDRHTADGLPLQEWYVIGALYAIILMFFGLWSLMGIWGLLTGVCVLIAYWFIVRRVKRWRNEQGIRRLRR